MCETLNNQTLSALENNQFTVSFQTSAYNGLALSEELRFAIAHNIPAFEIFFDGWMPNALTEQDRSLLHQAALQGMKFSVHAPLRDYLTIDDADEIMPVITFCRDVKAALMTVHFDRLAPDIIGRLHSALGDVKLSIENTVPDVNAVTGQNYLDYMRAVSEYNDIYATVDIGHAVVNGYEPVRFIDDVHNIAKIGCFHIHNNDGRHDIHNDITDGVIDYDNVLTFIFEHAIHARFVTEHWIGNIKSVQYFAQILQKWQNAKNKL